MKTTRRSFLGAIAAIPFFPHLFGQRVKINDTVSSGEWAQVTSVRVGDRLVDFKDLEIAIGMTEVVTTNPISYEIRGDRSATFKTLSGVTVGALVRITYGLDIIFLGRVQRWKLHRGASGPLFYEVNANACFHAPEGWFCSRLRGHNGPCAAYPTK